VLAIVSAVWDHGGVRGQVEPQLAMVMVSSTAEEFIPAGHPIRRIRRIVDEVLAAMDGEFAAMYALSGRPSVPPEALLKSCVLMGLYSIRSERQFCERLNYDLLFKWFLDMSITQPAFDPTTFTKNKGRLLEHNIAEQFFATVVEQARLRNYVSSDHFSVDGTLLDAWASHKSFQPKDPPGDGGPPTSDAESGLTAQTEGRNSEVDFHGQKRSNVTHQSTTDPEARLMRKSHNSAANLCFAGHVLIENRNGLLVDMELTIADGYAERSAALTMIKRLPQRARRRTVAADKAYDTKDFVADTRAAGFTPHVAQNTTRRRSAIDGRTTRHPGHMISQRVRKRVEEPFGWIKTVGGGRKLRYRGRERNQHWWLITGATYNIIRIANLDTAN
jgi:transposase